VDAEYQHRSLASPADPEQGRNVMDDLFKVGVGKPLGYLPLLTIISEGYDPEKLAADLRSRGLETRISSVGESNIDSGSMWVWDRNALANLLKGYKTILETVGWPLDPDSFVHQVITQAVDERDFPELYALVGMAFNDARFRT
jgi:hypothetical protein